MSPRRRPESASPPVREIAERVQDIIYRYRLRPEPGFEYVSEAATRITGYTPAEHYADPALGLKLVHPQDQEKLVGAMRTPPDGRPLRLRWIRKSGEVIWTEQRNVPVFDDDGTWIAVEGVAREVPGPEVDGSVRRVGAVEIDLVANRVSVDGRAVHLTPSELAILVLLTSEPGRVFSRQEIMEHLWGTTAVGDGRTCEPHVSNLRKKIERDPRHPERLVTMRGRGYSLTAQRSRA